MVFSKHTKHESKKKKIMISSPRPTKELTKRRFLRAPLKRLILSSGVSDFFREVLDHIYKLQKKKDQNMPKKVPKTHAWNRQDDRECNYTLRTLKIGVNGVQQVHLTKNKKNSDIMPSAH
ncbi:unnamed protein product [Meganyctiphanes norvegica]|uniref:Uncharacterized protein n=1 Tax=Meganyctiphanes norvegica TaxID=48144 RepID=A0AAV2RXQ8_MEGNR